MIVDIATQPGMVAPVGVFHSEAGTLVDTENGTYQRTNVVRFNPTLTAGYYEITITDGGILQAFGAVRVVSDSEYYLGDSISGLKDIQLRATAAAVAALASTGRVTVVNPVDNTGKISGAIVIGDDYLAANSRAFSWTIPAISGVTVGTAIASFGGKLDADNTWLVTGTITVDGANWVLSFDLPKTATTSLDAGYYAWSVEVASASGTEITRVRSDTHQVQLVEKQT